MSYKQNKFYIHRHYYKKKNEKISFQTNTQVITYLYIIEMCLYDIILNKINNALEVVAIDAFSYLFANIFFKQTVHITIPCNLFEALQTN